MIILVIISVIFPTLFSVPASAHSQNASSFSHEMWDQLLKKYVSQEGKVDYKGMKAEQGKLRSYLDLLSNHAPAEQWGKNEQEAYWINAYNSFTVELILENYPVKSIRDLKNGKPWDNAFIEIGEQKYSLNDIENNILRKKFSDPRVHFAINCASKSCPKLMNSAYTPEKLEIQLDAMAKAFINDPLKNKIASDKIEISQIFDWYRQDFIRSGSVVDFLNTYSSIKITSDAQVSYMNYDWSLNE
jgi:hypothetical protein